MTDALSFGSAWLDNMAPAAVRAALILLLTWVVVLALRTQAARLRSFVWTIGIAIALCSPLMLHQPVTLDIDIPAGALTQSEAQQQPALYLPRLIAPPPGDAGKKRSQNAGAGTSPGGAATQAQNAGTGAPSEGMAETMDATVFGAQNRAPARVQPSETAPVSTATATPAATSGFSDVLPGILGLAWLVGTLLLLARFAAGLYRQALRSQRMQTLDDGPWFHDAKRIAGELGLLRAVRLVTGEPGSSPQTWGVLYPTISIPAAADLPDDESRGAILRHELAHVARFDAVRLTVERLLTALFWWNPLAWLAGRRAQLDREQACDDAVLLRGARPSAYATQLLMQACGLPRSQVEAEGASLLSREVDGQLVRRVGRILDPQARRQGPPAALLAGLAVALILASSSVSALGLSVDSAGRAGARGNAAANVSVTGDGSTLEIVIHGDAGDLTALMQRGVRFGPTTEIESMPPDGSLRLKDERAEPHREASFEPDGSAMRTTYLVDGVEQSLDAEGRAWLDATLLELFRQGGLGAGPRVKRILETVGVGGILAEVDAMSSDFVRVTYLDLALGYPDIDDAERASLLRSLGKNVESEVERSRLIMSLEPGRLAASPEMREAALEAIASLEGAPVEQRRALEYMLLATAGDEEHLVMALEVAAGIESDVELGEFLAASAPFVPGAGGAPLGAWIDASDAIQGDVERGRALRAMLRRSDAASDFKIRVIESAAGIESDGEKAQLLVDVASHYRKSGPERAAYEATAATIASEYERGRALSAL